MIETRTRMMASEAYKRVAAQQGELGERYRALAEALPGMILQNGLAQATGFLIAKGKPEHNAMLADLNAVLGAAKVVAAAGGGELHSEIIGTDDPRRWMQITRHSLEASAWIKRYAQGLLKSEGQERGEDPAGAAEGNN